MNYPTLLRLINRRIRIPWATSLKALRHERNKEQYWENEFGEFEDWVREAESKHAAVAWERYWENFQQAVLPLVVENGVRQAIDIGCGAGWFVRYLAAEMDHVHGLDLSKKRIEFARSHTKQPNVTFYDCDIGISPPALPKDKYLVNTGYVLSHNPKKTVTQALRWVDSICDVGSVCYFGEHWSLGKTSTRGVLAYYHAAQHVYVRSLPGWDLSFFGERSTNFSVGRESFANVPRSSNPGLGEYVGKGIMGVKVE